MSYNFTKEQVEQAYNNLPENIREFYSSEEVSVKNYNIGIKYHLHIDAIGKMGELIGLIIAGLVPLSDFSKELVSRTGITSDTANLIIYDLNQQIFSKIRQELEEISQSQNQPAKTDDSFASKMNTVINIPKQEIMIGVDTNSTKIRDPYRESI